MTGVEGYIESAASGFIAGYSAACRISGKTPADFSDKTMIGAMAKYISEGGEAEFQPMNANFGIIAPFPERIKAVNAKDMRHMPKEHLKRFRRLLR